MFKKCILAICLLLFSFKGYSDNCQTGDSLKKLVKTLIDIDMNMDFSELSQARCHRIIVGQYFENVNKHVYETNLGIVDEFFYTSPHQINDLLISLQLSWEKRYFNQYQDLVRAKSKRTKSIMIGLTIAAGGIALIKNPWKAYKYKMAFEALTGSVVGANSKYIYKLNMLGVGIPMPPALLDNFGSIYAKSHKILEREHIRKLESLGAGTSAGMIVYLLTYGPKAVNIISAAATPLKINLLIYAGSIVVGWGVETISEYGLKKIDEHYLRKDFEDAKENLSNTDSTNLSELVPALKNYAQSAHNLAYYYMLDITRIFRELEAKELEIKADNILTDSEKINKIKELYESNLQIAENLYNKIKVINRPSSILVDTIELLDKIDNEYVEVYREAILSELSGYEMLINGFYENN